jgi:hypothetical protein
MIPVTFTSEQKSALKTLQRIWTKEQIVLVGASALSCFMDMRWRQTHDLDLSISVSLEDCTADLAKLPGWTPDPKLDQRWTAPGGFSSFGHVPFYGYSCFWSCPYIHRAPSGLRNKADDQSRLCPFEFF